MILIDKESLIEHMRKAYDGNTKAGFKWDLISAVAVIGAEEEITPDAEPIVRCKDCKYWNKHHFVDIYVCSIHNKEGQYPYLLFEMTEDDFCSRGERAE